MSLTRQPALGNFHQLPEILRALGAATPDASAAGLVRPLAIGEFGGAGILRSIAPLGMHRQPNHEEFIFILEGEANLRVAGETRPVRAGDFIYVPRNAVHGVTEITAHPFSLVSVFTPQFDLAHDVVEEDSSVPPPHYQFA
jgi:mannose-6-phosphate isomerase-like protein (cupin superfamily)